MPPYFFSSFFETFSRNKRIELFYELHFLNMDNVKKRKISCVYIGIIDMNGQAIGFFQDPFLYINNIGQREINKQCIW